jgi:hypothetical protein
MASNLRWCSDHFDVRCWNGDVVRVVFSLDTHDREIIAWKATIGGMKWSTIGGQSLRRLPLELLGRKVTQC